MKWLIPFLLILVGCNSVEPELGDLNGVTLSEGVRPQVSSLSLPASITHNTSTTITFTVFFSTPVKITGNPYISIITEGGTYNAVSSIPSGSVVQSVNFSYTPSLGHNDANGIQYSSSIILGVGGSIHDPSNKLEADLSLPHFNTSGVTIDTGASGGAGDVITFISTTASPKESGFYERGMKVCFGVQMSSAVSVNPANPTISVLVSDNSGNVNSRAALYDSGSGTSLLTFCYKALYTTSSIYDLDPDGIKINPAVTQITNGSSITKISTGLPINPSFTPPGSAFPLAKVDASLGPALAAYPVSTPFGNLYRSGSTLNFQLTFTSPVKAINDTPQLNIDIGGVTRYATWVSDNDIPTTTHTFQYAISDANFDADLDGIRVTGVTYNGSSFVDADGATVPLISNASVLTNTTVKVATSHLMNWYDLGSLGTTTTITNPLNTFLDILGINDVNSPVNIPYFSGTKSMIFNTSHSITLPDSVQLGYVIVVMNTRTGNSVGDILYDTTQLKTILGYDGTMTSQSCSLPDPCTYLTSGGIWSSSTTNSFPGVSSVANQKKVLVIKLDNISSTIQIGNPVNSSIPQIYEILFLDNSSTQAQVKQVSDQLITKHAAVY